MNKEDIENTNNWKTNNSNTWDSFVDPREYMDNKSARIYTKDGKTIYELELPFSNEEYYEVTKEEYDIHVQQQKIQREIMKEEYQQQVKHKKDLEAIGYTSIAHDLRKDFGYEQRILSVFDSKHIENIKQIPWYVQQEGEKNQIQLFQALVKKEKVPDAYETEIKSLLDTYEHTVEKKYISDDEIIYIGQLFVIWYIDNLELFYRFEQLKRKNIQNHYKRIYLFWEDHISNNLTQQETQYFSDHDIRYILYFLGHEKWTIADLDHDEAKFMDKVKKSYIHEIKKYWLWIGEKRFWSKYSWFERKEIIDRLWLTEDDFSTLEEQAKKEFIQELPQIIGDISIDWPAFTIGKTQWYIDCISAWEQDGQDIDKEAIIHTIVTWLKTCILQGIQKIVNKEKITTSSWRERKNLSYKTWIVEMEDSINKYYTELEHIDSDQAKSTWWQEHKEQYIEEYKDFHRNTFVKKRLLEVLKVDINDKEALEKQVLHETKEHFLSSCKKRIERKWIDTLKYNPLTHRMVIKYMINAFFRTGHALVLATAYPDNKERKALRQQYVQTITKDILSDIETRLIDSSTFSLTEYYMRDPIYTLYKRYWWDKILHKNTKKISANYENYLRSTFEKHMEEMTHHIDSMISFDTKENTDILYDYIILCSSVIKEYITTFLKKYTWLCSNQELSELHTTNKTYNENTQGNYPDWFINDFSHFWYTIENIEKNLDQSIIDLCVDWYTKIDEIKPQILQPIIQWRFIQNGNAGGKLQRLSQELLTKQFGVITLSPAQRDFLIQHFSKYLDKIIFEDLDFNKHGVKLFWTDKILIKKYIEQYMDILQQSIASTTSTTRLK